MAAAGFRVYAGSVLQGSGFGFGPALSWYQLVVSLPQEHVSGWWGRSVGTMLSPPAGSHHPAGEASADLACSTCTPSSGTAPDIALESHCQCWGLGGPVPSCFGAGAQTG